AGERSRLRRLYAAIKQRAASASGRALTLTKTELWSVPKEKAEAVMKAAARHGVIMARLGDTWNQVFHSAPADTKVTGKQKSMMDRATASKATAGVGLVAAPLPPMVEYALSRDAELGGTAKLTVRLNDATTLTLTRT